MWKTSLLEAARALAAASSNLAQRAAGFAVDDGENEAALAAVEGATQAVGAIIDAVDAGRTLPPNEPLSFGVLEPDGQVVLTWPVGALSPAAPDAVIVALFANPQVEMAVEDAQDARTLAAGYRRLLAEAYPLIPSGDLRDRTSAALQGLAWEPTAAEVPAKDPEAVRLVERSLRVLRELDVNSRLRGALQKWLDK